MNIFVLDLDPIVCATYYNNAHTIKIILESAQLLSNVHWAVNGNGPCNKAFFNHPCSVWARASRDNYVWLSQLAHALCVEYEYRYGKVHAWHDKVHWLMDNIPYLPDIGLTPFAQAMPGYCRVEGNAVEAYRNYYCYEKTHLAQWKVRSVPEWYEPKGIQNEK